MPSDEDANALNFTPPQTNPHSSSAQPQHVPQSQSRKPRRESRASLASHNEPASSISTQLAKATGQSSTVSQDLTVFSELTEPPLSTPLAENKILAADIQGGFSGLYNKFKASMGAAIDSDAIPKSTSTETFAGDNPGTRTNTNTNTSGRTSRIQSPRVTAADASLISGPPASHPISLPKFSTKSKLSLPPPGLRSPNAGPNLVNPTLTEITIHATNSARSHSRASSSQGHEEGINLERAVISPAEESNLRKVLSRIDSDTQSTSLRAERQPPILPKIDTKALVHSRGQSEASNYVGKQMGSKLSQSPSIVTSEAALSRVSSQRIQSPSEHHLTGNPLNLLVDRDPGLRADDTLQRVAPGPRSRDTAPKPLTRVSQSKLPGFAASRASSTDSGRTSGTLLHIKHVPRTLHDGPHNEPQYTQYVRPSSRLRNRLLKKEFWMRDENARDCFRCGEPFTTFRRKHHCRTCGQIFDSKCTSLIPGSHFDVPDLVRVCRPCEVTITAQEDDSSDYSDDGTTADVSARPRTPDHSLARYDDDNISMVSHSLDQIVRTPVMSLPLRRAFDTTHRSSAVFEFDSHDHTLHRPSSSRSLRTAHSMGHKRHHSKHNHIRSIKTYHDERVPFQKASPDDAKVQKTSAFHRDSVIDPELAQYLSDDASSDDDGPTLHPSASSEKLSRSVPESDRMTIGGLLAAMRKGRSRMGDRSIAGFLNFGNPNADDAASIVSSRAVDGPRPVKKRNLSVASSLHVKSTPRTTRDRLQIVLPQGEEIEAPPSPAFRAARVMRSASMHGMSAPSLELNRASINHVHKLLRQLLKDKGIPKVSNWENALIPILLKSTDEVDPDVQGGDDIDIRSYVKLKKIPGGRPSDTSYTSGLIFTKNVALKSMQRPISRPRILIITFPLEYARSESHFMSLDPVIRQEREYLENLVSRIAALRPDVLLAQKNISGLALQLLERVNIAVVYNVKPAVLEAVSRCTSAAIHHSIDRLTSPADELGLCDLFEVKTFLVEGRRKTYIYLSGCPPELGCTIALRGANRQLLRSIKEITDFMVYVVYNLKLETCLMRDEWALLPTGDDLARSSIRAAASATAVMALEHQDPPKGEVDHQHDHGTDSARLSADQDRTNIAPEAKRRRTNDSNEIPEDIPVPTFYQDLADKHESRILSSSPFVRFSQPYLLSRARELERRVAWLRKLRDQDMSESVSSEEKVKAQKFTLIVPEMVHNPLEGASRKVRDIVHAVHDAEYDKALYLYEFQKKQWEYHLALNHNLFNPYAHQEISVLFSTVSTHTHVPCLGPDMLAFKFYNEHILDKDWEPDCTLGQYVEDLCYRANDPCPAESCANRMHEHQRQYVHGEAQITVFIEAYPPKMRGLQDVILMWSTCKICGTETTVTPMSPSTWKYSFGKYLELSFWSADLHARAGVCPHDLHRDHLRFFGYKGFALRVHYDPIDLLEIIVPRQRITWKVDNDLRFRNDVFTKMETRITRYMSSVKLRLKSINVEALLPEAAEACRVEVERLTKQANEDHSVLIKYLQEQYSNSLHWEIIPLNLAIRALQEKVADWDEAFTEFEKDFLPSEKDIRRLATLQLKKIFLDRDVSVTSLTSAEDDHSIAGTGHLDEKQPENPPITRKLSPEKTQHVLQSVMEENIGSYDSVESEKPIESQSLSPPVPAIAATALDVVRRSPSTADVRRISTELSHLDLAVSESVSKIDDVILPLIKETDYDAAATNDPIAHQSPSRQPQSQIPDDVSDVSAETDTLSTTTETQKSNKSSYSQLPTPSQVPVRRSTSSRPESPMLVRTQSQPSGSFPQRMDSVQQKPSTMAAVNALNGFGSALDRKTQEAQQEPVEKKLSERLGLSHLKSNKLMKGQSLIPRAISSRKESRVSNLAKHFEQLTREFEQARIRERRQRAARNRRSQFYPTFAPKPTVQVYSSVNEAVDEADEAEESLNLPENKAVDSAETIAEAMAGTVRKDNKDQSPESEAIADDQSQAIENDTETHFSSHAPSEVEEKSDVEEEDDDDEEIADEILLPDSPEDLLRLSQEDIEFKELQKHERTSLMKMLTNFWAERSSSGWSNLEYPFLPGDHIFSDCDIIVREDELSSIIAFALDSTDYKTMLSSISGVASHNKSAELSQDIDGAQTDEGAISHSLLRNTGTHLKYSFGDGPAKFLCKVFFAEQFDAMRKKCGIGNRFVESISRCMKFENKGGKSKSIFLKTLDDRFVLKSLSPVETQSFLKFAPNYFQIMSEAFFHEYPTVIAKMVGFYQIIVKNPITGIEHNWFLLVMENLFYDRVPTRIFDLKGSMRNRKTNATGELNEVLLDENMVDYIYETPLFAREHSKKILRLSVHNDTLFLARQNVMDYSLMIGMDETRKELVVGIIDCIRTYTWDKKLESWMKDRGFISAVIGASGVAGGAVSGGKNRPTVTSPREYKRRFREAMSRYVLEAPSCWHQFKPSKRTWSESRQDEGNMQANQGQGRDQEQDQDQEHEHDLTSERAQPSMPDIGRSNYTLDDGRAIMA